MKKRTSEDFVKGLPKLDGKKTASPLLRKTIKVAEGKAGAETALIEPKKSDKIKYVGHVKTANEKFFDFMESKTPWAVLGIAAATAFIALVAYWGIKQ